MEQLTGQQVVVTGWLFADDAVQRWYIPAKHGYVYDNSEMVGSKSKSGLVDQTILTSHSYSESVCMYQWDGGERGGGGGGGADVAAIKNAFASSVVAVDVLT